MNCGMGYFFFLLTPNRKEIRQNQSWTQKRRHLTVFPQKNFGGTSLYSRFIQKKFFFQFLKKFPIIILWGPETA